MGVAKAYFQLKAVTAQSQWRAPRGAAHACKVSAEGRPAASQYRGEQKKHRKKSPNALRSPNKSAKPLAIEMIEPHCVN